LSQNSAQAENGLTGIKIVFGMSSTDGNSIAAPSEVDYGIYADDKIANAMEWFLITCKDLR